MSDFTEVNVLHGSSVKIPRTGGHSPFMDDLEDMDGIRPSPVQVKDERGVVAGGNSSIWDASFNFINSIVGAGIIGISLAIQQCSFILGMILLALVALLVNRSVVMLIECGVKNNKFDLEDLSEAVLGPFGYYFALFSMILYAYGAQIAYVIIIGDTFPLVMEMMNLNHTIFANREFIIALFAVIVMLPICLQRDLGLLSSTSFMSIFANAILILVILVASIHIATSSSSDSSSNDSHTGDPPATTTNPQLSDFDIMTLFSGIGSMSFAFVCQHNSFLVFRTLQTPSLQTWQSVANISVITAYVLSLSLGLIGFFTFSPHVQGDLLNNFPVQYVEMTVARGLLGVCMLLTYPMECFVTRHCILMLIIRWEPYFNICSDVIDQVRQGTFSWRTTKEACQQVTGWCNNPAIGRDRSEVEDILDSSFSLSSSAKSNKDSEIAEDHGFSLRVYSRHTSPAKSTTTPWNHSSSQPTAISTISKKKSSLGYTHSHHLLRNEDEEEEERVTEEHEEEEDELEEINFNTSQHIPSELLAAATGKKNSPTKTTIASKVKSVQPFQTATVSTTMNELHRHTATLQDTTTKNDDDLNKSMMNRMMEQSLTKFTNFTYFLGENVSTQQMTRGSTTGMFVPHHYQPHRGGVRESTTEEEEDKEQFVVENHHHTPGPSPSLSAAETYPGISMCTYVTVTLLLWGSTVFIAMMIRDLGVVNSLTGVVAASTLGYTLPGLLYLQTNRSTFFTLIEEYGRVITFLFSSQATSHKHHTSRRKHHRFGYEHAVDEEEEDNEEEEEPMTSNPPLLLSMQLRGHHPAIACCHLIGHICYDFRYFTFAMFLIVFGIVLLIMGIITIFMNQK